MPASQLEDQASAIGMRSVEHPRAASGSYPALNAGMGAISLNDQHRRASSGALASPPQQFSHPSSPILADAPLALVPPSLDDLGFMRQAAGQDIVAVIRWARDLLRYVERTVTSTSISDPRLVQWIDDAIKNILYAASLMPPIPEALYLRAELGMSGSFPSLIPRNPKVAFRDFEAAANAEYAQAWYKIGREYESFKDAGRAKSAYESGLRLGDATCTYRLAMAHLLGQLELPIDTARAVDLLRRSAMIAERFNEPELAPPLFVCA